jgi:hypothetical protein
MDLFQCGSGIEIDCCHSENEKKQLQATRRLRHIPGMEWRQGAGEPGYKDGAHLNPGPHQPPYSPASANSSRATSRSDSGPYVYPCDSDRSDISNRRLKDIPVQTLPGYTAFGDLKSARGVDPNLATTSRSYKDSG